MKSLDAHRRDISTTQPKYDRPDLERSAWVSAVKTALGVDHVLQDKFHVSHGLSKYFNNHHDDFYGLVIHAWRNKTSRFDETLELENDTRLLEGQV